jgi:hypothetical protein
MPVAVYRRGAQRVRMRTTGTSVLPPNAADAQQQLLELIASEQTERALPAVARTAGELPGDARTMSL